jgi:hypothetical protein
MQRGLPWLVLTLLGNLLRLSSGCDSGITGATHDNVAPETRLSVRDTSLVDNLAPARLASTVAIAWSGTDPDGFVTAYELRFYDEGTVPGSWSRTTRTDSLVLLPIPRGARTANAVFEVRALDNQGATDPTPARTVFPIQNSPPTLRLDPFESPPDTTFGVFSLAWEADDPEGTDNLARIEVSFNDSLHFVTLPAETRFATFVSEEAPTDPTRTTATAAVFSGRAFQRTGIQVPGLRLNAANTVYVRAVDATDTTSTVQAFTWFVKRQTGEVLVVNDYRTAAHPTVLAYHLRLLQDYLPAGIPLDVWDVTQPYVSGAAGNVLRSNALPASADPTLRQMLARYRHLYWVSTAATNSGAANNLPFAASVLDLFFANGGTLMVHVPITLPASPEENLGNPAILLLPLTDLVTFPDSLRSSLRLPTDAAVTPVNPVPGVAAPLPPLRSAAFQINTLPFITGGNKAVPLYEAAYTYLTRTGNRQGPWTGEATVAALTTDRRVGLFALPLVNDQNGTPLLTGTDDNPEAARQAVWLMLESLGFPKR